MSWKQHLRRYIPRRLIGVTEELYRYGRAYLLQGWYGFPARHLKVIAVTGTNGKTTTCHYINHVLKSSGYRTAMLTSTTFEVDGVEWPNHYHTTVPKTGAVLDFFRRAKRQDTQYVIVEVTSHALHQHKFESVPVEIAVITNLTQDHLDYHGSMHAYAQVKSTLLSDYRAKWAVLNIDDQWFRFFRQRATADVVTYGAGQTAAVRFGGQKLTNHGSTTAITAGEVQFTIRTSLLGSFNIYNATAAATVGLLLGCKPKDITTGIERLHVVPGRMEVVEAGQNFTVVVDYAHTSDALEHVLQTLRQITKAKLRIVFGATGDRDVSKRPLMGRKVAQLADDIYLTDDETYHEDPERIRQGVLKGIQDGGGIAKTHIIADRREAIEAALGAARKGDVVVLAGIGHEHYRNMGGQHVPWDEYEVATAILKRQKRREAKK